MKSATLFTVPNIAANIGISFESTRTKINLFTLLMFFKAILKGLLLIEFDADGKKKTQCRTKIPYMIPRK